MLLQQYCCVFIIFSLIVFMTNRVSSQSGDGFQGTSENEKTTFFFYQHSEYPRDCHEVLSRCASSNSDGVYLIKPDGYPEPFEVYCNNSSADGGWTIIQRRHDGDINFNRSWEDYKKGFGFLAQEFYLGNEKISHLTNQRRYKLRIDITSLSGPAYYVTFNDFRIGDNFGNFKLVSTGQYNGTAGSNIEWCNAPRAVEHCKCEGTCADPSCTTTCSNSPMCVCPDGFLLDGSDCVPMESCGCFLQEADGGQGRVLKDGEEYVNPSCNRRCSCNNGQISCDDTYQCGSNANCEETQDSHRCVCMEGFTGDGLQCTRNSTSFVDCGQFAGDASDSIQLIKPAGWTGDPFQVTCDSQDGGGWLVFQRRVDSSLSFFKYWNDYKEGFGSVDENFWLGNDKIAAITSQGQYELRIDLVSTTNQPYYAKYSSFSVGNEGTNYLLSVSGYESSSTVGYDAMNFHNGQEFTTRDRDNDAFGSSNCANDGTFRQSAWWFNICGVCDLNAPYTGQGVYFTIYWGHFPEGHYNIQATEMKIRPRS